MKKMYKYFCNSCGCHFKNELPERNDLGLLNNIACPHCGAYDIYSDTAEDAKKSVDDLTNYENKQILWNKKLNNTTNQPSHIGRVIFMLYF